MIALEFQSPLSLRRSGHIKGIIAVLRRLKMFQSPLSLRRSGHSLFCGKLPRFVKYSIYLTVPFYGTLRKSSQTHGLEYTNLACFFLKSPYFRALTGKKSLQTLSSRMKTSSLQTFTKTSIFQSPKYRHLKLKEK